MSYANAKRGSRDVLTRFLFSRWWRSIHTSKNRTRTSVTPRPRISTKIQNLDYLEECILSLQYQYETFHHVLSSLTCYLVKKLGGHPAEYCSKSSTLYLEFLRLSYRKWRCTLLVNIVAINSFKSLLTILPWSQDPPRTDVVSVQSCTCPIYSGATCPPTSAFVRPWTTSY